MASGRNGYFNDRAYEVLKGDKRIGRGRDLEDTLQDAKDVVEMDNDPNWEPDDS